MSQVYNLREKVKHVYNQLTKDSNNSDGLIFDERTYKFSSDYYSLIDLLETHCASYKKDDEKQIISNSTLHKFFTATPTSEKGKEVIDFAERTIEILNYFVDNFRESLPTVLKTIDAENQQEAKEIAIQLQKLYEEDEIIDGAEKANKAYLKFPLHYQVLKHVFRFNMRLKEWELLREIVANVLKENPSDMIKTQCYLTLFECELREANSNYKTDVIARTTKILSGKKLLNQIPDSQRNYCQFLYWNGKWLLELWHSSGGTDISYLTQSLSYFERAIKQKYTWWYHCYKCIILKLLNNKNWKGEAESFTEKIIEEKKLQPKRPSVRTYRIASFLLNDDIGGLESFLKEHNVPTSPTDFQSTAFHHIELIFYKEPVKQEFYKNILENWVAYLPLK